MLDKKSRNTKKGIVFFLFLINLLGERIKIFIRMLPSVSIEESNFLKLIGIAFLLVDSLLLFTIPASAIEAPYAWAYADLDVLRAQRFTQLENILNRLRKKAKTVADDKIIKSVLKLTAFDANTKRHGKVADLKFASNLSSVKNELRNYYIENYYLFYDILFVDPFGVIVHTIRNEKDTYSDLTQNDLTKTPLGQCIARRPKEIAFIDYHNYPPSSEPAAFFVVPIYDEDSFAGWVALQCSVNKINALFAPADREYRTMETLLVNENGEMLTDSLFFSNTSVLRKQMNLKNIPSKFNRGRGRLEVIDYRGKDCLTSFQVVRFKNTRWLMVAKVDKDEVVTKEYLRHKRYYTQRFLQMLSTRACPHTSPNPKETKWAPAIRVDMDEFYRAECGQTLRTFGISTCTGMLAIRPKEFAYMAHLSNRDRAYGGGETDIVGQILKNIEAFDVPQSKKQELFFLLVAPHLKAVPEILDQVLAKGYLLSQVYILSCSNANSGEIRYDCEHGVQVIWSGPQSTFLGSHRLVEAANLGDFMKELISKGAPSD